MAERDTKFAEELLDRYNAGACDEEERLLVDAWFNHQARSSEDLQDSDNIDLIGREIWAKLPASDHVITRKIWPKAAAAAAIILVLFSIIKYYERPASHERHTAEKRKQTVSPGTYGATLTLANGKQIKLGEVQNGVLAEEPGVAISKTDKGELVYHVKSEVSGSAKTNTLATAKGETFKVDLPDGSSVWLNAASSLTYSTNMAKAEIRSVTLTGEAYFKVAKDAERPFIVKTAGHEIRVLGTEFNVSSYPNDDSETTTLLQGRISLNTASQQVILTPGEKGTVSRGRIEKASANIDAATGWKNNEFVFVSQDIRSIMKLIARWYDVEVSYRGEISTEKISGSISRFANINSVLNILEATGAVKIKSEGNRITITDIRK